MYRILARFFFRHQHVYIVGCLAMSVGVHGDAPQESVFDRSLLKSFGKSVHAAMDGRLARKESVDLVQSRREIREVVIDQHGSLTPYVR